MSPVCVAVSLAGDTQAGGGEAETAEYTEREVSRGLGDAMADRDE